ncbi:SGNH hydrolase [Lepidopterella palustris CBS 459.81]|uniref:SGNH hydrolase n=1 Tax=Lepidopterella palustris CBS 459.81 TaxID=1314670 RepID=A0A8E2E6U1_9PEZI|nr:SGNH hydrolase [Lepidopterella palustris CBS 459.81]
MAAAYDQFFLFGDSITEQSSDQGRGFSFAAALQYAYIRRLDVVNRGFSGYNTDQAVDVLPMIIPAPEYARIRFLMVFFGANDASIPEALNKQHVPLARYRENLLRIVTHPAIVAHKPRVILVTPPPVNEHLQWIRDKARGFERVSRTAVATKSYADAVCELGKELGIPVLNLWKTFISKTGWKIEEPIPGSMEINENSILEDLMHDGLHFNPAGYRILYDEMMKLIAEHWPDQLPENLPYIFPTWNDDLAWETFEQKTNQNEDTK